MASGRRGKNLSSCSLIHGSQVVLAIVIIVSLLIAFIVNHVILKLLLTLIFLALVNITTATTSLLAIGLVMLLPLLMLIVVKITVAFLLAHRTIGCLHHHLCHCTLKMVLNFPFGSCGISWWLLLLVTDKIVIVVGHNLLGQILLLVHALGRSWSSFSTSVIFLFLTLLVGGRGLTTIDNIDIIRFNDLGVVMVFCQLRVILPLSTKVWSHRVRFFGKLLDDLIHVEILDGSTTLCAETFVGIMPLESNYPVSCCNWQLQLE